MGIKSVMMPLARKAPARPEGSVVISGRGLELPKQLPFDTWLNIGRRLSDICTSSAWCLGDWLVYGEASYNGRYRDAIEYTSLDYQTLRNYAWVVKRFALPRRRDTLSFGHHAEVAALPEPEQDFWLRKAEELSWPVKELRRQVRASLAERSADDRSRLRITSGERQAQRAMIRLNIRMSFNQSETWQAAADSAGLSVQEWAVLTLEEAAQRRA
jgi:hypothetical protein